MKDEQPQKDVELRRLINQYPEETISEFRKIINNYKKNLSISIRNNIEKTEVGSSGK